MQISCMDKDIVKCIFKLEWTMLSQNKVSLCITTNNKTNSPQFDLHQYFPRVKVMWNPNADHAKWDTTCILRGQDFLHLYRTCDILPQWPHVEYTVKFHWTPYLPLKYRIMPIRSAGSEGTPWERFYSSHSSDHSLSQTFSTIYDQLSLFIHEIGSNGSCLKWI